MASSIESRWIYLESCHVPEWRRHWVHHQRSSFPTKDGNGSVISLPLQPFPSKDIFVQPTNSCFPPSCIPPSLARRAYSHLPYMIQTPIRVSFAALLSIHLLGCPPIISSLGKGVELYFSHWCPALFIAKLRSHFEPIPFSFSHFHIFAALLCIATSWLRISHGKCPLSKWPRSTK